MAQLPKGAAKARKRNLGLFQPVLPGAPPPTPGRNYYWLPTPFVPADNNFVKPQLPLKPQLPPKPLFDEFARPLTKIIKAKKIK